MHYKLSNLKTKEAQAKYSKLSTASYFFGYFNSLTKVRAFHYYIVFIFNKYSMIKFLKDNQKQA